MSENSQFCEALVAAGIVFIGPNQESILEMGDKIRSKAIAKSAGVFTIPGFQGVVEDAEHAVRLSADIGYPVMLKASAGGGGKGMRIAYSDNDVRENFEIASSESQRSFGDARLLIEKYVEEPRHIEIQIIGDQLGTLLYLPERECSIQRRNQKVIEEAPSTFLDPKLRQAMGEQAVALAKRVGYFSAGTVEFLVDRHRKFYFLEMNTRLQVEHPITELITGVDLVELMILAAAKLPLPFTQQEMNARLKGWAIESRVYAENPATYLPSVGTLSVYREPKALQTDNFTIRCDSGIVEGSEISMYYDPMICKLSTFGETREIARLGMIQALDKYLIEGVTHNIPLLREVLSNENFITGKTNTAFLPTYFPDGFSSHLLTKDELPCPLGASAILRYLRETIKGDLPKKIDLLLELNGEVHHVSLAIKGKVFTVKFSNGKDAHLTVDSLLPDCLFKFTNTETKTEFIVQLVHPKNPVELSVRVFGSMYNLKVYSPLEKELLGFLPAPKFIDMSKLLVSPMPGSILSISCNLGDSVVQGAELMVIEAMKMQNVIRAPCDGTIKALNFTKGDSVSSQDVLVEFE